MDVRRERGSTLVEALIAAMVAVLAALTATVYVTRSARFVQWSEEQAFARQRALSILGELESLVGSGDGTVAADLDGFDDGAAYVPALTVTEDPGNPGSLLPPDHPVSGNVREGGKWRWYRRISIDPLNGIAARDIRVCTVHVFRTSLGQGPPGERVAKVSSVIRTVGDAYPTTQVYDLYLVALENVPGWWVDLDAIQPLVEAILTDLESRNRGLQLRTHWITKLGYGRDDEYAPYTNEERTSTETTPWAYVYPGRLPSGEAAERYYVAGRMRARVNVDGATTPAFVNDYDATANPVPYALADGHNHCLRWPEAEARFEARVAAGLEDERTPTWRLLLDRMASNPDRYHNALVVNLHGELLPLPPVRNVSDAAKNPVRHPGWRAVTHPERLRPRRVAGDDANSDAPRFRVYAWQTRFPDAAVLTTQEEPLEDLDGNGIHDAGEVFQDWNGNAAWDAGAPLSIVIRNGDFSAAPNDAALPSIRVQRLPGGVDADGDGSADDYVDWNDAPRYPEAFADVNTDGVRQVQEAWLDLDGDGLRDADEPHQELDGDGAFTAATEALTDVNGNGAWDDARPAESFTDANGNGLWDAAEPYWDRDGSGAWTPPTTPVTPWVPWDPAAHGIPSATELYIQRYGEPFLDLDGDQARDGAEDFFDANGNGVRDGGFTRGEMFFEIAYDATADRTVLHLHGTPLRTPYLDDGSNDRKGLPPYARLYDVDYVPCPTPTSPSGSDRFERDLYASSSGKPKNTARWTIELPLAAVREAFASAPGYGDGDHTDRIITLETRFGKDLTTGTAWPVHRTPPNRSVTYAYFYADAADVPLSERHQFLGDPRHSPYLDTDGVGTTAPHGYNWYFDDFECGTGSDDWQDAWPAFHAGRLAGGWCERGGGHDVPRLLAWLRAALCRSEAVFASLNGRSFSYLSLGGDVGSDAAHGFSSGVPMSGIPFGLAGTVYENTLLASVGSSEIRGSVKYVRENSGSSNGLRSGGYWWSKPWLGELYPDDAYAAQWKTAGNLRAASGSTAGEFHLIRRGDVPTDQLPGGTRLASLTRALGNEGCTSFFNTGTSSSSTFHHQDASGTGNLTAAGEVLASGYGLALAFSTAISRPYGLATSGSGGAGDEFPFVDVYPRCLTSEPFCFYDHPSGQSGSGIVRLREAADPARAAWIGVSGLDPRTGAGSTGAARRTLVSVLHAYLAGGLSVTAPRIRQLPRLQILGPAATDELNDPDFVSLVWRTTWERWDGRAYTPDYVATFVEDEAQLVYVPMYSADDGATWKSVLDDQSVEPGVLPWTPGLGPNPSCTVFDSSLGGDESLTWPLSRTLIPAGAYLIRIDAHRADEPLHYAQHVERIHVHR